MKNRIFRKIIFHDQNVFYNLPMKNEKKLDFAGKQTKWTSKCFWRQKNMKRGITYCLNLNRCLIEEKVILIWKKILKGGRRYYFSMKNPKMYTIFGFFLTSQKIRRLDSKFNRSQSWQKTNMSTPMWIAFRGETITLEKKQI